MISNWKEMSLDILLQYAQRNNILTEDFNNSRVQGCHFPYDSKCVTIGRFAFQVHCHDTGNSVAGYILTEDKPYEIIRATFWKSSGYEHNKDKWERGAWDKALLESIDILSDAVHQHKEYVEGLHAEQAQALEDRQASQKQKVEALFANY